MWGEIGRYKLFTKAYLAALCVLHCSTTAIAAPIITSASVFTDNRPIDDLYGVTGYRLNVRGQVSDPFGVPNNISSFVATHQTTNETHSLVFQPSEQVVLPGLYVRVPFFQPSQVGAWTLTATNNQGEMAVRTTHNLDRPVQLPLPTNFRTELGQGLVRVSIDPVPGADDYTLETYRLSGGQFIGLQLQHSVAPTFVIPVSHFNNVDTYVLRVYAHDRDFSEPGAPIENRSVNAAAFSLIKESFFSNATNLGLAAAGAIIAGIGVAALAGVIALPISVAAALTLTGAGLDLISLVDAAQIAADPPDSNYTQQVTLQPITLPSLSPEGNFTPELAAIANAMLTAQAAVASELGAALTALERYQGAREAGNYSASLARLTEFHQFVALINIDRHQAAQLSEQLHLALMNAGIQETALTTAQLLAIQQEILQNGFPDLINDLFAQVGFTEYQEEKALALVAAGNLNGAPRTYTGFLDVQSAAYQNVLSVSEPTSLHLLLLAIALAYLYVYRRRPVRQLI